MTWSLVRGCAEAADRHARIAGDQLLIARALAKLAVALPAEARLPALEQAAAELRRGGNDRDLAISYSNAAYSELVDGRFREALALLDEAMPVADLVGDPFISMPTVGNLGVALLSEDFERARDAFIGELRLRGEHVFRSWAAEGLGGLAALSAREGEFERAARLLGAATVLGRIGDRVIEERLERDFIAPARASYGRSRWRRAEQAGAAMSFQEAIAYATAGYPSRARALDD